MAVELDTMEVKKTQQITSEVSKDVRELPVGGRVGRAGKVAEFLGDVKLELTKINWTTPDELRTYTKIVIVSTFCFGMGVYFADLLIQGLLGALESLIRLIGG